MIVDRDVKVHFWAEVGNPLLSICIPTYRRPEKLMAALQSAICQVGIGLDYEVLVVDNDGSGPPNHAVLDSCQRSGRVSYVSNSANLGMVGNWNACIRMARGKWVTILCDDDLLDSRFARYFQALVDSGLPFNYVQFGSRTFEDSRRSEVLSRCLGEPVQHLSVTKLGAIEILFGGISANLGAVLLRESVLELGGFDEGSYPSFDHELSKRCLIPSGRGLQIHVCGGWYCTDENASSEATTRRQFFEVDARIYRHYAAMYGRGLGLIWETVFQAYTARSLRLERFGAPVKKEIRTTINLWPAWFLMSFGAPVVALVQLILRARRLLRRSVMVGLNAVS